MSESISRGHENDLISRRAAMDALNEIINRFEQILRNIRESKGDDSVCGMCEYDGAYIGQSGDWCNECPGFDKDDCFKLSDECRKRWLKSVVLPSAQPERKKGKWNTYYHGDFDFSYSCNKCGYSAPYQMIGSKVFQKKWNFCPNCGADMRGEDDEAD